jgi:hypothetical protein
VVGNGEIIVADFVDRSVVDYCAALLAGIKRFHV